MTQGREAAQILGGYKIDITEAHRWRGELGDHLAVGERRELEASVLLRDDHPPHLFLLHQLPGLRGEVAILMNLPVVRDIAEAINRPIEEGLLLRGQFGVRDFLEFLEVGFSGKEIGLDPDDPRLEGDPLRFGDLRKETLHRLHDVRGDEGPSDRSDVEDEGERDVDREGNRRGPESEEEGDREERPQEVFRAGVTEDQRDDDGAGDRPDEILGEKETMKSLHGVTS